MDGRVPALGVILAMFLATPAAPAPTLMGPRVPGAAEVARAAVLQGATSDPGVVSWGPGRLDLFVRGQDNALWHKYWANNAWSAWASLGGGLASGPAVASYAAGHLDVFVRGTDNALHHRYFVNNAWSGWESLGGGITSDPAAVSWGPGRIDVFARGTDNALWQRSFAGAWGPWVSLGGALASGPAVASWAVGRLDLFVRGADNALHHKWYEGTWSDWGFLGGTISSDPAAVSHKPGRLDVFARGTDNLLHHKSYEGSWSAWATFPGGLTSAPDAASQAEAQLDVFARGTDNNIYHRAYNAGWSNWAGLGAPPAAATTAVLMPAPTATATPMAPVTITGNASSLVVSWAAVPNAELYRIDRVKEGDPCCNRSWTVSPPTFSTTDAVTAGVDAVYQYSISAMMPDRSFTIVRGTYFEYGKLNVELAAPISRRGVTVVSPCEPAKVTGGVPPATVGTKQYGTTRVTVDWTQVAGAAAYLVERQHKTNATIWFKLGCVPATANLFSETTRSDLPREETPYPGSSTYTYKITAFTSTGAAGWNSGTLYMLKGIGSPYNLTATRTGNSIKLCWNAPTGSNVGPPERYRITSSYGIDYSVQGYVSQPGGSPTSFCTTELGLPMGTSTFQVRGLYYAIPKYLEGGGPSITVTVQP